MVMVGCLDGMQQYEIPFAPSHMHSSSIRVGHVPMTYQSRIQWLQKYCRGQLYIFAVRLWKLLTLPNKQMYHYDYTEADCVIGQ